MLGQAMLIENMEYSKSHAPPELSEDHVFRYCRFEGLGDAEIRGFDATFLACTFKECDYYWALFNVAIFAECKFENCTFRGVTFAGCLFVECSFVGCSFTESNMGGPCTFENTRWYGCNQSDCTGLLAF